jgi:hypothetical protein
VLVAWGGRVRLRIDNIPNSLSFNPLAPAWQYKTYLITEWNIGIRLNAQIDNGLVATLPLGTLW